MNTKQKLTLAGLGVAVLLAAACYFATPAAVAESKTNPGGAYVAVTNRNADSIVEVTALSKMSFMGQTRENKLSIRGTIVDDRGIVVVSKSSLENRAIASAMPDMEISVDPSTVKVTTGAGDTFEGTLIAQDAELDIAFIRIEGKDNSGFKAIGLGRIATVRMGDGVVGVSRLAKDYNYSPVFYAGMVNASVTKPRPFWLAAGMMEPGTPVFTNNGDFVGLVTVFAKEREPSSSPGPGGMPSMMPATDISAALPIVLPAADLIAAWEQVKESIED